MAQKYSTVPAVEKVCENLSLVSSALERNLSSFSETRCGMSSALIQVTVVPALTVKVGGSNVKFAILTWASTARAGGACMGGRAGGGRRSLDNGDCGRCGRDRAARMNLVLPATVREQPRPLPQRDDPAGPLLRRFCERRPPHPVIA